MTFVEVFSNRFRKRVLQVHPDKGKGSTSAAEFHLLVEAKDFMGVYFFGSLFLQTKRSFEFGYIPI